MADPSLLSYVAQRTGMKMAGAQQRRLSRVVSHAWQESRLSPVAYAELLKREQPAFDALADDLTVGETYFFRERPQLELLREAVQEDGTRSRPLRAWSAGCSTGEEAYTLAMLLGPAAARHGVEVTGTDLSPTAVVRAASATYGSRSLRATTEGERDRWFEPAARGQVRVRESVRRCARFSTGNLLDGPPQSAAYDVVLCRNVLIYLSPEAVARVGQVLQQALLPTGWLLTGVADPILEADGLERVATREGVIYRRSGRGADVVRPGSPPRATTRRPRIDAAQALPRALPLPARPLLPAPVPAPAAPVSPGTTSAPASVETCQAAVEAAALDASLRYRLAVLQLENGDLRAAADAATAATFLDPALVVAHLLLARIHEARQDSPAAQRSFRNAAALLDVLPGDAPVHLADGETAVSLARVVGRALGGSSPHRKDLP